ncbi:hypothetical protein [Caenibius tardaugens]|nr:hypothetical protein [Caenibius tardaugens]
MKTVKSGHSGGSRGLRAGVGAAILTVVACFGAAIALTHSAH